MSRSPRLHPLRGQILFLGTVPIETAHGAFRALIGRNLATGAAAFAVHRGDLTSPEPLLARIHSSCVTSETFGGCDCDCVEQLDAALDRIAACGRGVVFYLMQEGRGAGFAAKARDRMLVQASRNRLTTFDAYASMGLDRDCRRYEAVGHLYHHLGGCAPLRLLTSNPEKLDGIKREAGVTIVDVEPVAPSPSPWNRHYIAAKTRSGHHLADPGETMVAAEPPEMVEAFEPYALPGDERFVHLASYWLPIRRGPDAVSGKHPSATSPLWFRLHAYADLVSRVDRVVLEHGRGDAPTRLVRVQRESLLERFPLAGGGALKSLWQRTVRQFAEHGSGCATFLPSTGFDERLGEHTASLEPGVALLARHLRDSRACLVTAGEGEDAAGEEETARRAAEILDRAGVGIAGRTPILGGAATRPVARPATT